MAEAFPDRMCANQDSAVELVFKAGRLGQKNGKGFYQYIADKKGKIVKTVDAEAKTLIAPVVTGNQTFTDQEIIERMMIPMCLEIVRCLDEGIVSNAIDADMGLLMGLGFPLFRGGPVRYMESQGLAAFVESTKKYQALGELYAAPQSLVEKAAKGESFFGTKEQ